MRAPESAGRGTPDFLLLILTLLLVGFGLVMVFSASSSISAVQDRFGADPLYFAKRQIMWVAVGTVIMLIMMNVPYDRYKKWYVPFLLGTVALLAVTPFVADVRNGARSWIGIGSFGLQPTEFAKLAMIMYLAAIIAKKQEKFREFQRGLLPVMIVVGFIAFLIMLQPDLGSCVILLLCASAMIVTGGSNLKHVLLSGAVIVGLIGIGMSLYMLMNPDFDGGYRLERFTAYRDPFSSELGEGRQILRSLEALGHGGLTGAGLGNSVQKLFYLTYAYNDFIFAVIGEELGFIGTAIFILLYLLFLWRGLIVALRCPDIYGTLIGVGLVSLIAVQALINMGGVSGAIPITGVTLPFISYGGSSLLTLMMGMGLLLSISREYNRNAAKPARREAPTRATTYRQG